MQPLLCQKPSQPPEDSAPRQWAGAAAGSLNELARMRSSFPVALLSGERRIGEQSLPAATHPLAGTVETRALKPGIYTLEAKLNSVAGHAPPTARRQVVVAPAIFDLW
jgi:hypothetical protein